MLYFALDPTIKEVFDFSYNPYSLFSLLAVVINSYLLYAISSQKIQTSTHKWLSLLIIDSVVWGVSEFLTRISNNSFAGSFWDVFAQLSWLFVAPLTLAFCLSYVEKNSFFHRLRNQLLVFGPSFIFLYLGWTTNLMVDRRIESWTRSYYGQWVSPVGDLFSYIVMPWIAVLTAIGLLALFKFYLSLKDNNKRKQTLTLLVASLFPFVGGTLTNGLFLILNTEEIIQVAVLFTSVMCLIFTYGMVKYQLFVVNPATVVSNIVESMDEILLVFGLDYRVEFVNKTVEKILGFKKENLIGADVRNLFGLDWSKLWEKALETLQESTTSIDWEAELLSQSGEKVLVKLSVSAFRDDNGRLSSYVLVATDLRGVKELFEVRAERNKLKSIMESISDGVLAVDLEGYVTMVNTAALRMFGLGEKDVLGSKLEQFLMLSKSEGKISPRSLFNSREESQEATTSQVKDVKFFTRMGKQGFVNLIISTIREGRKVGLGGIVVMHDIALEKQLEEMKLDFVSMAAHELRTPLTSIKGYLAYFVEEYGSAFKGEQKTVLDRMEISINRLSSLIENLLNVSRIERKALNIKAAPLDWLETVRISVNDFTKQAHDKGLKIMLLEPTQPILKVMADKLRIGEVLNNLLENAINYTNTNGQITVWVENKGNQVLTHVSDTGQGIPEEAKGQLFTKFYRVVGELGSGAKGTGLGLYLSKAIVEMHGGNIWVESELGKGSTFSFSLPAQSQPNPVLFREVEGKPTKINV